MSVEPATTAAAANESCAAQTAAARTFAPPTVGFALLIGVPAAVTIVITFVGNLMVLFFKARVGRRQTMLLVWNLGLADFLVGVFVLPFAVIYLILRRWPFGRLLCRVWVCCDIIFCTASIITIGVISVDRYLAVTRPLRYKIIVTKTKVVVAMASIWLLSGGILLTTVRWKERQCDDPDVCFAGQEIRYLAHSVVFAFFIPAIVTLSLYWKIYSMAKRRQRALDRGFLILFGQNMNLLTNAVTQGGSPMRVHFGRQEGKVEHQRRVLRTHERIAKTLGVVSSTFLFCWVPFFALYLINSQCDCVPPMALDVASWLGYCNSMANPIIYAFTVKEFTKSTRRLLTPLLAILGRCNPDWAPKRESRRSKRTQATRHAQRSRMRELELMHPPRVQPQTIGGGAAPFRQRVPTGAGRKRVSSMSTSSSDGARHLHRNSVPNGALGAAAVSNYSVKLYCLTPETTL